ncbi:unnamed protein product [Boreogadus saida]
MREKKGDKDSKKSGSAARTAKKWKFFVVLSFLDPFVTPRETSSNLPRVAEYEIEDNGAAETSLSGAGEAYEECDEAAGPSHNADQPSVSDSPLTLSLPLTLPLPQDHRAGRRGREPAGYRAGKTTYKRPSSRPCIMRLPRPPHHPSSRRTHSSSRAYFLPWRDCHAKLVLS